MSRLILENELLKAVEESSFIKNGADNCCDGMKYDFRVSQKLLSPRFSRARIYDDKNEKDFVIKPGETAFVVTEEELELPNNMFCQLSAKRKLSHDGILLLGGFSIDPNYKGKLFFGLYNLSKADYPFIPGKKLVAGIFHELSNEEASSITSSPEPLFDFPDDLIKNINSFRSISTESVENQIQELRENFSLLKEQIDTDKSWKEEFKRGLTENNDQISKLGKALDDLAKKLGQEIDERRRGEASLKSNYSVIKGIGMVLGAVLGGGLVSLIVMYVAGILNFG